VSVYLETMACVAPLSAAEEMECIEHVRAGGPMAEPAAVRLLEAHLALVVSIAQRYENPRVHILDLIQAGNMGLLGALEVSRQSTLSEQSKKLSRLRSSCFEMHCAMSR
jgi:DNA-directed RNA polymerase sigma subunit (sigma70/sigma32)